MSQFNENYSKAFKYLILSENEKQFSIKKTQDEEIKNITKGQNLECSAIEVFNEEEFYKSVYISKCHNIINSICIPILKNEFQERILNFDNSSTDCLMNIGLRISLDEDKKIVFEEWRNVINKTNKDIILLSLHKIYSEKKYEIKLSYNFCTYTITLLLNDSENNKNFIDFLNLEYETLETLDCYSKLVKKNLIISKVIYFLK